MSDKSKTDKKMAPNDRRPLIGAIEELKANVYTFGTAQQGNLFSKVNTAIGDYCGREHGKPMKLLFEGKESPPKEPTRPTEAPDKMDPWDREVYRRELDQWIKLKQVYKENKGVVFLIIMGQCSLAMRNKIESSSEYSTLDANDDVIGLLKMIKDLTFTTTSAQYKYWKLFQNLKNTMLCRQFEHESLSVFYKRWKTNIDVVESLWGGFVPTKLESGEDKDTERDKFLACVFLGSLCIKKYGKATDDLNNDFLDGNDNYPPSAEEAMSRLSYRMDRDNKFNKNPRVPNDSSDGTIETSFAQEGGKKNKQRCHKCGGKGHYANQCPTITESEADSDGESSIDSRSALQTRPPTPYSGTGWADQY